MYVESMKMAVNKNKRFFEKEQLNEEHLQAKTKSMAQVNEELQKILIFSYEIRSTTK